MVDIIGVTNPNRAGYFEPFVIETYSGLTPKVIEQITVPGPYEVLPGSISIIRNSAGILRTQNTTHQLDIIFENSIPTGDQIWIKIPAGFRYRAANCTLLRPLTAAPDSSVSCGLATNQTGYIIQGFQEIPAKSSVSVELEVENPPKSTDYIIQVFSFS